ncbi:MAG: tyrosine-protein phosphatase [Bacteroidota bacterium]
MKRLFIPALLFVSSLSFGQAIGQQKDTLVYSSRRAVVLEGTSNFRDLGGYPTKDKHHVKWGHIYRSADISKLTDQDLQALSSLHIATVCDLRGPDEVKNSPDRLPTGAKWVNLPAGSENLKLSQMNSMMRTASNRDSMMTATYAKTDHLKAKYKPMFDELLALDGEKALLFHCTAGKDRTGIGAALVLSALGVDRSMVIADYEATNEYWKRDREARAQQMIQQGMDEKTVRSMMSANPAYLEMTFKTIEQKYGSMDKFLQTEMELTPKKLAKLRAQYTN